MGEEVGWDTDLDGLLDGGGGGGKAGVGKGDDLDGLWWSDGGLGEGLEGVRSDGEEVEGGLTAPETRAAERRVVKMVENCIVMVEKCLVVR